MDHDFSERIRRNNAYYDLFAQHVERRSERRDYQAWVNKVSEYVPRGGRVLDIGCGSGLHMTMFRDRGYEVIGVEPSSEMRRLALAKGLTVIEGAFETLGALEVPTAHAIWCAASLLHVPAAGLPRVLTTLHSLLIAEGVLYITVRLGDGVTWDRFDGQNDHVSRFIQLYDESLLLRTLAECGYRVLLHEVEQSYWGRPAPWIHVITRDATPRVYPRPSK